MGYIILGIYLLGFIIHFRLFVRQEDSLLDGWGLIFTAFYFSLLSWIAVITYLAFNSKSQPPRWLTGKKK